MKGSQKPVPATLTKRLFENMLILLEEFISKNLTGADSVIIFDVNSVKLRKYGNAIHRDKEIVYF